MSEHETEHDAAGDELREQQQGNGYGEDEGERDPGLERDDARVPDEPGADSR
jgi:hypothetical protein